MFGRVLGLFIAIAFWFMTSGEGYELVSALILGWSLYFSWKQLVVLEREEWEELLANSFEWIFSHLLYCS